jgi:hypothetical protein
MGRASSLWNRLWDGTGRLDEEFPFSPIAIVQNAMANPFAGGLASLSDAFEDIVRQETWRGLPTNNGNPFESFGDFATAELPIGLGICSRAAARLARNVLLQAEQYAAWTEILERIARKPGRPKSSVIDGDLRFYSISKAPNATDRLLLLLKRHHPNYFDAVCNGDCTPYRAAINAGEVVAVDKSPHQKKSLRFGVCNIESAGLLSPPAQAKLLAEIFKTMRLDAQCRLIESELEPALGPGLAQKWRSRADHKATGS